MCWVNSSQQCEGSWRLQLQLLVAEAEGTTIPCNAVNCSPNNTSLPGDCEHKRQHCHLVHIFLTFPSNCVQVCAYTCLRYTLHTHTHIYSMYLYHVFDHSSCHRMSCRKRLSKQWSCCAHRTDKKGRCDSNTYFASIIRPTCYKLWSLVAYFHANHKGLPEVVLLPSVSDTVILHDSANCTSCSWHQLIVTVPFQ